MNKRFTSLVLLATLSTMTAFGGDTIFVEHFETQEAFNKFKTIDSNADGTTWAWDKDSRDARCLYSAVAELRRLAADTGTAIEGRTRIQRLVPCLWRRSGLPGTLRHGVGLRHRCLFLPDTAAQVARRSFRRRFHKQHCLVLPTAIIASASMLSAMRCSSVSALTT